MLSKKQEVVKAAVSRDLFVNAEGEPMCFFLRPGPVKVTLQPLITAGGGLLCNVQTPGSILLIGQEERDTILPSTAHWYVSVSYIYDCIERGKALNIADYRLDPKDTLRQSKLRRKDGTPGLTGGRNAYTPEEDAAILSYVKNHKSEIGGNRLWQTMHRENVTSHSWQSMKYRFKILAKKLEEEEEEEEETTKMENEEDSEETGQKASTENAASPQTHSLEDPQSKMIQLDPQLTPAETSTPEDGDAETAHIPQPEEPPVDLQEDVPLPPNSTDPQAAEPQTSKAPQEEDMLEETLKSPPCTSTPIEPKENQGVSLKLGQRPQHRRTRRQLVLGALSSPEHYGKRLRLSNSCEKESTSSQSTKKTKAAGGKHTTVDPLPSAAESEDVENIETPHLGLQLSSDEEPNSLPQKEDKKKERRALGILEVATNEFEVENEFSEEEAADFQNRPEIAAKQPTSAVLPLPPSDTATDHVSSQSSPESLELILEEPQQTRTLRSDNAPETGCAQPHPAAPEPGAPESEAPEREAPEPEAPEPVVREAPHAASRAHLFIFDNESQEDNSQSLLRHPTEALSKRRPPVNKDAALSLTQVQLEEDMQQIRELMNKTHQDLVSVTKALLRTSGDVPAALNLLLNPSAITGPLWTRNDEDLLLCTDPDFRQQLQDKYGEQELAKRIVFLGLEK